MDELLGRTIGCLEWMYVGLPVVLLLLPVTWLVRVLFPVPDGQGVLERR